MRQFGASGIMTFVMMCGLTIQTAADIRSIDGSGNNLNNPSWGSAGNNLRRITTCDYTDGISSPSGNTRPSARLISNLVVDQPGSILNTRNVTDYFWAWGQFLAHDIELIQDANPVQSFNVLVPTGDPQFDPTGTGTAVIPLNRSEFDPTTGTSISNPRQQQTFVSAWIDGSAVYGSDTQRAAWLRTNSGGRLKVTPSTAGDLLPYNDGTQENLGGTGTNLFVGGDVRANEQSVLLAMHTLFVREHNRLADQIATANPTWDDEQIYQKARKLVGAEMQVITFKEFLPALLGSGNDNSLREYKGYDPGVDGSIRNVFSAAAYRVGHTTLSSVILRIDEKGHTFKDGNLPLDEAFFNLDAVTTPGSLEALFRGLHEQKHQEIDVHVVDEMRNLLFLPGIGGLDIASLNMQRGRDHGLPDYNQLREDFGLAPVTSFSEITSSIELATMLECVYGSVENIDPWLGMLSEDHVDGSGVGELMGTIIRQQFEALRDGDSFWYQIDSDLTASEMAWLENLTLSQIIVANTDIITLSDHVFVSMPEPSTLVLCLVGLAIVSHKRRRKKK